jgi:hypothetical protein
VEVLHGVVPVEVGLPTEVLSRADQAGEDGHLLARSRHKRRLQQQQLEYCTGQTLQELSDNQSDWCKNNINIAASVNKMSVSHYIAASPSEG